MAAKKKMKLVFPHEQGQFAGQKKSFFNIECVARDGDGLFECEIDEDRARLELRRKNQWRFVRPESLVGQEDL